MSLSNSFESHPCEVFLTNFVNKLNSDDRSKIYSTFNSLSKSTLR